MAAAKTYKAFISYKHLTSTSFAERLEAALKSYAKPLLSRPIKIFRDEKHFAPGLDLPKLIREALDDSEFLVLLASPQAAKSEWVHDELDYCCGFLEQSNNLIVVLLEGQIAIDQETKKIRWSETDALPPILSEYLEHVPLYVDLRHLAQPRDITLENRDFLKAVNGISARFRNIDPNDMLGEEIRQHRKNIRLKNLAVGTLAALTLVSILVAIFAFFQRQQAVEARIRAEQQQQIAEEEKTKAQLAAEAERRAKEGEQQATKEAQNKTTEAVKAAERERRAKEGEQQARRQAENSARAEKTARQDAEERRKEAEQNLQSAVIATSESCRDKQLDLAMLLAVEAQHMRDTPSARGQLLATLGQAPGLIAFLHGHTTG